MLRAADRSSRYSSTQAAPVAVGGVGGSGTRVVAEVLRAFGLYMGSELNTASDNLWFTLLFRRPDWYRAHHANHGQEVGKALSIFDRAMRGSGKFDENDYRLVIGAFEEVASIQRNYTRPLQWADSLINAVLADEQAERDWGWKEPNTHMYLEHINDYFDGIKYVHVIRHGLDMVFSRNQFQFLSWGELFGLPRSGPAAMFPRAVLEYWIRANRRAIASGEQFYGDRFMLLRFEDLCASPEEQIGRLAAFLGRRVESTELRRMAAAVHRPKSIMRYKCQELDIFTEEQLAAVEEFGFSI